MRFFKSPSAGSPTDKSHTRKPNPNLPLAKNIIAGLHRANGAVAEWSKAHAWKACRRETVSRVRIPVAPPLAPKKRFSRSRCGRIFPLFSRVMRERLSTGPGAKRAESVLYRLIFSGPVDCADPVNFLQGCENKTCSAIWLNASTPVALTRRDRGRIFPFARLRSIRRGYKRSKWCFQHVSTIQKEQL